MQYDDRTEIRNTRRQKRSWKAASVMSDKELAEWIRDALDQAAAADLLSPQSK